MKKIIMVFSVIAFLSSTAFAATPKVIAAKFHADWCGSCQTMKPMLANVKEQLSGKDVLFVTFDKTDEAKSHNSQLLASSLGIEDIYNSNDKTGFVLLIDNESKEIVGKLTKTDSTGEMVEVISSALS